MLRYCAVCHPYTYRDLTQARTVARRVLAYVVPVLTFSVCLNIPKFFETRIVYSKGGKEETGERNSFQCVLELSDPPVLTVSNLTVGQMLDILNRSVAEKLSFETSELRDHPQYIRWRMWR